MCVYMYLYMYVCMYFYARIHILDIHTLTSLKDLACKYRIHILDTHNIKRPSMCVCVCARARAHEYTTFIHLPLYILWMYVLAHRKCFWLYFLQKLTSFVVPIEEGSLLEMLGICTVNNSQHLCRRYRLQDHNRSLQDYG